MHETCAWRQLIKILLPVLFISVLLLMCNVVGAEGSEESRSLRNSPGKNSASNPQAIEDGERSHKVKAKWKGEQFWAITTANLTKIQQQQTNDSLSYTPNSEKNLINGSKKSGSSKNKSSHSSSSKRSHSTRHRHRSTLKKSSTASTNITTTSLPSTNGTDKPTESKNSSTTPTTSTPKTPPASTTTMSTTPDVPAIIKSLRPKTSKPKKKLISPTVEPLDRSTLIADLGPYQDFYLEYESNEEEYRPLVTSSTPKSTTELGLTNTTTEIPPLRNTSQLHITFFPKTPVNLLYLLQAYASNMKPIELKSPIVGGPSGTIAPSTPVRVPVNLNPPNSPFLFSLDLDNFFTRMAISFFYSSIAIAPMAYMLYGGLGSLAGLKVVPFTGKRRKKRDSPGLSEIVPGLDSTEIEEIFQQVMQLYDFFTFGDEDEFKQEKVEQPSQNTVRDDERLSTAQKKNQQRINDQPKDTSNHDLT